jgi:hypothetical protein
MLRLGLLVSIPNFGTGTDVFVVYLSHTKGNTGTVRKICVNNHDVK